MVNSLISLSTDRDTKTVVASALAGRIAALAGAYQHVMPPAADVLSVPAGTLHGLLQDLFIAYSRKGEDRIGVKGHDVPIGRGTATALALLFHKFATNAVNHGSLANPDGRVGIIVTKRDDRIDMRWQETGGGDAVDPGSVVGFGTGLADRVAAMQLGAIMERDWHADGLTVRMSIQPTVCSIEAARHMVNVDCRRNPTASAKLPEPAASAMMSGSRQLTAQFKTLSAVRVSQSGRRRRIKRIRAGQSPDGRAC